MKKTKGGNVILSWHPSAPPEYESSDLAAQRPLIEIIKQVRRAYADVKYREVSSGAVWNEDEPGKYAADLNTAEGLVKLRGAILEEGSFVRSQFGLRAAGSATAEHVEEAQTSSDLWDQLLRSDTSADKKAEALAHLIAEGAQQVTGFLVSELSKATIQPDWLDKLIFAAEQIEFKDAATRATLKQLLHRHAVSLLQSGRFRSENALWAAIRRYASLVEEAEVQTLQPFLEGKASIATRQVTLQAIHAIFQQSPPKNFDGLTRLAERVHELATKYVDPDLLVSPDNTSLALNAMITLSAMGNRSSVQLTARMREIGNQWLLRRGAQTLEGMLMTWKSNGQVTEEQKTAIQNVADSLSELRWRPNTLPNSATVL